MENVVTFPSDPLPAYVNRYFRLVDGGESLQELRRMPIGLSNRKKQSPSASSTWWRRPRRASSRNSASYAKLPGTGSEWSDDRLNRLIRSIVAGVERLAAGGAA